MTNNGKEEPVCNDKIYFKVGMKNIMRYIYTTKYKIILKIFHFKEMRSILGQSCYRYFSTQLKWQFM